MTPDSASPIFQWLNANSELAGLFTFLISAGESVAIIGTVVPGSIMMTAIGALVGAGVIPFWSTMIWAILGAIAGDGISYWLGHYFKDQIHYVWPFRKYPQVLEKGELFFRKYGGMSVFIGRFVGPVRALVPMVAGMMGVKPLIFTIANVTSAIIWAPAYMLPGIVLGAAALEVPSEVGARLILILLLSILFIILCIWLFKRFLELIRIEINQLLNWIWDTSANSRYFFRIISLLKHHDPKKTHGQLGLAIAFVLVLILLAALAADILIHGSNQFIINNVVFHLFRSIRTSNLDQIMLYITLLGDKFVLLPLIATLTLYFIFYKRYHTATHVFALGIITSVSIESLKYCVKSQRPWGVMVAPHGFSFPSGHTTLALVFYLGLAIFFVSLYRIRHKRIAYSFAWLIITSVAISRLYFGVHWLTDVIGAILLGIILLILVILSYNRKAEEISHPGGVVLTVICTLIATYSFQIHSSYNRLHYQYTMIDWPTYSINFKSWWGQEGNHLPLFRINRYGFKSTIFNVQWLGEIENIKQLLLKNEWEVPSPQDWMSVFYRISSVQSTEHLPLISPLYLDKPPVLVLKKYLDNQLVIIRFWDSHIHIQNSKEPLWLGSIEYAPSTYNWIFKRNHSTEVPVTKDILFSNLQDIDYDLKLTKILINDKTIKQILLLKPKNLYISHLSYGLYWQDTVYRVMSVAVPNYWS